MSIVDLQAQLGTQLRLSGAARPSIARRARTAAQLAVPHELDPRSPLFRRSELHSALIAVGGALCVVAAGLTIGLVALFG